MKISVIIPVYNAEKTISKCLDSIINQSYSDLEIIVVNDGSNDNSHNICLEYADKNEKIKYYYNENHGVSYSRNFGVNKATGEFITFVDSDDYLELDTYETLKKYLNDDIDFIRYNFESVGGKSFSNNLYDLKNKTIGKNEKEMIYNHFLVFENPIPNLVMLLIIKKELAKKISFNEKLTMMEDVDYYLQLFLESKKMLFVDEKKYKYYVNPGSVTHSEKNISKNIYGIVDTNSVINKKCENVFEKKFVDKINANHLRIISNILINSKIKYSFYKNIIDDLNKKNNFTYMLNNYDNNSMNNYNCLIIKNIKNEKKLLSYILIKVFKYLKALKNIL